MTNDKYENNDSNSKSKSKGMDVPKGGDGSNGGSGNMGDGSRWHIGRDGGPHKCHARIACPYGGMEDHYRSFASALNAVEQDNRQNAGQLGSLSHRADTAGGTDDAASDGRPVFDGEAAEFHVSMENYSSPDLHPAYSSKYDMENDLRLTIDSSMWDDEKKYDEMIDDLTLYFGKWIDYANGTWEGTDVPANLAAVANDDFWKIVQKYDPEA